MVSRRMTLSLRCLPRSGETEETDRAGDAPHPREMLDLVGHGAEEAAMLEAYRSGRGPHAWIIGGEEGIGKATLAYRFARFLLANPNADAAAVQNAVTLEVSADDRAARLVAAAAHPDLCVLRRAWNHDRKRFYSEIRVDEVRKMKTLFQTTPSFGGWRIAIVDPVEDLNASSANALLKLLEEPPARSMLLIVSHAPGRVLPTLRSRARMQRLRPLSERDVADVLGALQPALEVDAIAAAARSSLGSVRRGLALLDGDTLRIRSMIADLLDRLPKVDGQAALAIAQEAAKRDGLAFEQFVDTLDAYLSRMLGSLADRGSGAVVELADIHERLSIGRRETDIYNLDRKPLVLATIAELADAVRRANA